MSRQELIARLDHLLGVLGRYIGHVHRETGGLTPPQFFLMRFLARHGPARVSNVAATMGVTNGAITGLSDRLVEMGLVRREHVENDRRLVLLDVTDEGRRLLAESEQKWHRQIAELLSPLDDHELALLADMLEKLVTHVGD